MPNIVDFFLLTHVYTEIRILFINIIKLAFGHVSNKYQN